MGLRMNFTAKITTAITAVLVAGCANMRHRDLASFNQGNTRCYDRQTESYTSVVNSHLHFRPFGGPAIPLTELTEYFNKTGILFANMYGIGQSLSVDSACTYYLDCPGTPALPSIKNDFANAANYLELKSKGVYLTLSMTFPDLANPTRVTRMIHFYNKEYPKMFKWMGEVNLIKQGLCLKATISSRLNLRLSRIFTKSVKTIFKNIQAKRT